MDSPRVMLASNTHPLTMTMVTIKVESGMVWISLMEIDQKLLMMLLAENNVEMKPAAREMSEKSGRK